MAVIKLGIYKQFNDEITVNEYSVFLLKDIIVIQRYMFT